MLVLSNVLLLQASNPTRSTREFSSLSSSQFGSTEERSVPAWGRHHALALEARVARMTRGSAKIADRTLQLGDVLFDALWWFNIAMEFHCFKCVNPLWPFSIAMLNYRRVTHPHHCGLDPQACSCFLPHVVYLLSSQDLCKRFTVW